MLSPLHDCLEPGARERRGDTCEHIRCRSGLCRIDWIRLQRRRLRPLGCLQRGRDEGCGDAPLAIALAYIEAGDCPDRCVVQTPRQTGLIEIWQRTARRKLTPPDGKVAIECEETRRRAEPHERPKLGLVPLPPPFAIRAAEPPVHAPAPIGASGLAEQVFYRRP